MLRCARSVIAAALLCGGFVVSGPAWAGEEARFLFSLGGVPVGVVTLSLEGDGYRYSSEHLFTRGTERQRVGRSERYAVDSSGRERDSGRWLESLWLWRQPSSVGCVEGREELGSRRGLLCARRIEGDEVRGEVFGEGFLARYRARRLRELRVGAARFVRIEGDAGLPAPPPDLFGEGWPVSGGNGALEIVRRGAPAVVAGTEAPEAAALWTREELEALARRVHRELEEDPHALCTDFVARFVAEADRPVRVVHGVVAEPGGERAFPHVWIRAAVAPDPVHLDPVHTAPVHTERSERSERSRSGSSDSTRLRLRRSAATLSLNGVDAGLRLRRSAATLSLNGVGGVDGVDVDPTLLIPVTPSTHAELITVQPGTAGEDQAGRAWLELLRGSAQVRRR